MDNKEYYTLRTDAAKEMLNIQYGFRGEGRKQQDKISEVCLRMNRLSIVSDFIPQYTSTDEIVFQAMIYKNTLGMQIDKVYHISINPVALDTLSVDSIITCIKMHIKARILEDLDLEK